MSRTAYAVSGAAWLTVAVIVGAVCFRAGVRDEQNKRPIFETYAVTIVGDRLHMPRCIRLPKDPDLTQKPVCDPLWFSPDVAELSLGERVQATYVDAVLEDGTPFQGYVISPLGHPAS